ncbi:TPA: hypothetical protein I8Y22_002096 [Raoultella planticola]|nr:hypothetical protein [Raoultella planticola]
MKLIIPHLTISRLDKLDESPTLIQLNRRVREQLPLVDLLELLLKINIRNGYTYEFSHVSLGSTLLAKACNM